MTWVGASCFFVVTALSVLVGCAWAGPCTTADASCTERLTVGAAPLHLQVYRTFPLETRNPSVVSALVVVHGQGRDADNYFRHALAGAFLANALDDTIVVAPRFASNDGMGCRDTLAPGELNWNCQQTPEGWRAGGPAVGNGAISAFDAMDEILRKLARKDILPNLRQIVVAGHSAGGQFVQRYQFTNRVHENIGVPVVYVVANPSSYAYLDSVRPTQSAVPSDAAAASPGYVPPSPAKPPPPFTEFADARNCTAYDDWPYGLGRRTGYAAKPTADELKRQFATRPTAYLLGEFDILPVYGFDSSCSAAAQGPTRLARGLAYATYARDVLGAQHKALVVAACGHNARCMFTADPALRILFPKP
jgi:pimeloyl-ACP methyl ester carboxylesterase